MLNAILKTLPYTSSEGFEFGLVEGLEYINPDSEKDKSAKKVAEGEDLDPSKHFTGYVWVKKFTDNVTVKALFIVPLAGRSMFMGGMPERGSICFMCKVANPTGDASRVIIGFVPVPVNMMIAARKEMESLNEGEMLFQGSTYDETMGDFYSSASMKYDCYGRLLIENGQDDFRIVIGDLLSNEYTKDVDYLKDSITGEVVCFQEKYKDKYSRSIDRSGNTIFRALSVLWDVMGDEIHRIAGRYIISSSEQIRLEQRGNYIDMSKDGFKVMAAKDFIVNVVGGAEISSGSYLAFSSFLDLSLSTSASIVMKALKEFLMVASGKVTLSSSEKEVIVEAFEDIILKSLTGKGELSALQDVAVTSKVGKVDIKAELVATLDGSLVKLGAGSQPVLKGTSTQLDLSLHQHTGNFGYPTSPPLPAFFLPLNILSTKVFTE